MRLQIPIPAGRLAQTFGVALAVLAVVAVALLGLGAVGFRFDPFDLQARRLDQARTDSATAGAQADAATLAASGARDTTTRVEIALTQAAAARDRLTQLSASTRSAPDANEPLEPARADRLRDFDQQLCAIRPVVCQPPGDAAPARDAEDRD